MLSWRLALLDDFSNITVPVVPVDGGDWSSDSPVFPAAAVGATATSFSCCCYFTYEHHRPNGAGICAKNPPGVSPGAHSNLLLLALGAGVMIVIFARRLSSWFTYCRRE